MSKILINSDSEQDSNDEPCSSQDTIVSIMQSATINYVELTRKDIEEIIEMKPINIELYKKAFVHKSVIKFSKNDRYPDYFKESYERFEFLGDSVLNLVVANYLFVRYPSEAEGFLTRMRTKLVNGKTLAKFAIALKLNKFIIMSNNVENINGRNNPRILEDIFEALICSINLDLGFKYAEKFIISIIEKNIDFEEILLDNNYKDILLRFCQNKMGTNPTYNTYETIGPPHNRTFKVNCLIENVIYKSGTGRSKKLAEQQSAKETLIHFKVNLD